MYQIVCKDGLYHCYLKYQDGTEEWSETDLDIAIENMIRGAYAWNHSRINSTAIEIIKNPDSSSGLSVNDKDAKLLEDIKLGYKVALDFNDFRLVANLTPGEVETIYAIREGRLKVVNGRN